jgi:hypothetical protein
MDEKLPDEWCHECQDYVLPFCGHYTGEPVPVEDPVVHEIAAGRPPKPRVKCRPV